MSQHVEISTNTKAYTKCIDYKMYPFLLLLQIIEDSEERLSEEQVEELIGLVELHLPDIDNPQTLVNGTPGK